MKYTEEQKKRLKNKGMNGFTKYDRFIPNLRIEGEFDIYESKMNTL